MTNIHIYKFKILCKHKKASEDFAHYTLDANQAKNQSPPHHGLVTIRGGDKILSDGQPCVLACAS